MEVKGERRKAFILGASQLETQTGRRKKNLLFYGQLATFPLSSLSLRVTLSKRVDIDFSAALLFEAEFSELQWLSYGSLD